MPQSKSSRKNRRSSEKLSDSEFEGSKKCKIDSENQSSTTVEEDGPKKESSPDLVKSTVGENNGENNGDQHVAKGKDGQVASDEKQDNGTTEKSDVQEGKEEDGEEEENSTNNGPCKNGTDLTKNTAGDSLDSTNHENDENKTASTESVQAEEKKKEEKKDDYGVLVICGGTNWDLIGRKELPKSVKSNPQQGKNLWGPHVWRKDVRIREIISSCTACHSVLITEKGEAMVFGRNDKGQLGTGDLVTRYEPTVVDTLRNIKMKSAATGKGHSIFLTESGVVYAVGDNKMGQLGIGTQSSNVLTPTKISYSGKPIVKVACGAEFSLIVDSAGNLYSFGSPEYGQLGHNSEGKYFTTGNKISYHCETTPRRVVVFIEKTREGHTIPLEDVRITDVASGINHSLAVDTKKRVFTWGFAGYGRLGHNETKDELIPRNLKLFDYVNRGVNKVWAGGYFSLTLDVNGVLYFWGQTKASGEATMYPKPIQDLCNWHIRSAGCANKSIVVAADDSVISWGPSPTYGELGYGENKAKSSTTPQEVKILDKIYVKKVTCGYGHTLMIAEETNVDKLPKWP